MSNPLGSNEDIDKILRTDPLAEAEKLTGKSYKDDEETAAMGLLMHMANARRRNHLMEANGDSTFRSREEDYIRIIESIGFEKVWMDVFEGRVTKEREYIFHNPAGFLLYFNTYTWEVGDCNVNRAEIFFNWKSNDAKNLFPNACSGGLNDDLVFCGNMDAREAVIHNVTKLLRTGQMHTPIDRKRTWIWFVNYIESSVEGYDHKAITQSKMVQLPQRVRESFFGDLT